MAVSLNPNACSLGMVAKFFDMDLKSFRSQWAKLSADDKAQLRNGIGDGSYSY